MSIEVENKELESPNGELVPPSSPKPAFARLPVWRQRRHQLIAVFVAIAFVVAVVGNNVLASQYTAEGAARQYLSALQSGDATKAWDAIKVTAPTSPATATYIDRTALEAAFAVGKPDIKGYTLMGTRPLGASATSIDFAYDTSAGSKRAKLFAEHSGQTHFGFYPAWHLVIIPTILQITLPKGSNGVSIDGKSIALRAGASTVAVLPMLHKVQFNGTLMLAPQTVSVDAFMSSGQSVTYQPKLTVAGLDKAKAAAKAGFDLCAQKTSPNAAAEGGCPQTASTSRAKSGQWRVVGDPSQDLTVSFDLSLNASGLGHYQMVFAYEDYGAQHELAAGGYRAALALTATDVTVGSIGSTRDAPDLKRPAEVSDQAAKDLVARGFAQCAKSTVSLLADCPQYLADAMTSNISWSLSGDPVAGATVSFDASTGAIAVQGNVPMTASYLSGRTPKTKASFTRTYVAHLLWDGQALQLVTIVGAL
jgi:hypothetical protein